MASVNERIANRLIHRDLELARLVRGMGREVRAELDTLRDALVALVYRRDLPLAPARRREVLAQLIEQSQGVIRDGFSSLRASHRSDSRRLAVAESIEARSAIDDAARMELATVQLSPATITALLDDPNIEGAPAAEWWRRQGEAATRQFHDLMRAGVRQGETVNQLARRVRGQWAETTQRNARAMVRTSVNAISSSARLATIQANAGPGGAVKALQQRSTLDGRTTHICMAYAGKQWDAVTLAPIGHDLPFAGGTPRHWACRSTIVPVVKSWDELAESRLRGGPGVNRQSVEARFRKSAERRGLTGDALDKARIRTQSALDGYVAEDLDFEAWLRTQPEAFQRKTLGPGRWAAWGRGEIRSFRDLVDAHGSPLTIAQIESRAARRTK